MIIAVLGARLLGPFGLDAQRRRSPKWLGEDGFGTYGPHPVANDPVSSVTPLHTLGLIAAGSRPPRPRLNSQVRSVGALDPQGRWASASASSCQIPRNARLGPFSLQDNHIDNFAKVVAKLRWSESLPVVCGGRGRRSPRAGGSGSLPRRTARSGRPGPDQSRSTDIADRGWARSHGAGTESAGPGHDARSLRAHRCSRRYPSLRAAGNTRAGLSSNVT